MTLCNSQTFSEAPMRMDGNTPLAEIAFVRLGDWQCSGKDSMLTGHAAFGFRIFLRYCLPSLPTVNLDFRFRGSRVSAHAAGAFRQILSVSRAVSREELRSVWEVIELDFPRGLGDSDCEFEHSEVGDINGRQVLALYWTRKSQNRKFITLYYDAWGDGSVVRELQFAAPVESFDSARQNFSAVVRSIQWVNRTLPPISTSTIAAQ